MASSGPGRNFIIGGSVLAAGLGGYYMTTQRNRKGLSPETTGKNHDSQVPPPPSSTDQNKRDSPDNTNSNTNQGKDSRRLEPTPQREASGDKSKAYTKKTTNYEDETRAAKGVPSNNNSK